MADDGEEDEIQMSHQRQGSDQDIWPTISLSEHRLDLVHQHDHGPTGIGTIHISMEHTSFPRAELLSLEPGAYHSSVLDFHAHPDHGRSLLDTDGSSLTPSLATTPVTVPSTGIAGGFPVLEKSPKGTPNEKYEEFVPNSRLNRSQPVFRSRVYNSGDIDPLTYHGRLASFFVNDWNVPFMDKRLLAEVGFMYDGFEDEVVCTWCHRSLRNWEPGDDPREEHLKNFGVDCFAVNSI